MGRRKKSPKLGGEAATYSHIAITASRLPCPMEPRNSGTRWIGWATLPAGARPG